MKEEFTIQEHTPTSLTFGHPAVFSILLDGTIERGPGFTTQEEASLKFWDAIDMIFPVVRASAHKEINSEIIESLRKMLSYIEPSPFACTVYIPPAESLRRQADEMEKKEWNIAQAKLLLANYDESHK